MKKISIFLCLLAWGTAAFTQDNETGGMPDRRNAVKLNLTSLAYKNFGLQYERALTPKIAVAGQLRFMPKGNLSSWNNISSGLDDPNQDITIGNAQVGSFAFTPEFRFYPKHVMRGFYLAPYLRLRTMSMDIAGTFRDSTTSTIRTMTINGNMTTLAGGLMIGSHFNIGKSFSLDWFILGLHYSSNKGNLDGAISGAGMSAADQTKLQNEVFNSLEDSRFFKNNVVTVSPNSLGISTKFGMIGFRGFGLNFGYRF